LAIEGRFDVAVFAFRIPSGNPSRRPIGREAAEAWMQRDAGDFKNAAVAKSTDTRTDFRSFSVKTQFVVRTNKPPNQSTFDYSPNNWSPVGKISPTQAFCCNAKARHYLATRLRYWNLQF
jgi:hypothetical protein